jgi:exodeoxyribonuclease VII small subunit
MMSSPSDRRRETGVVAEAPLESLSFDELLQRLEEIVQDLESDELSLDASIETFERGVRLAERCQRLLSDAELRISQITNEIGETAPYATGDVPDGDDEL